MAYANKEQQREYQRNWLAKRKADYFADKKCIECGAIERLELDHKDPKDKVDHRIWSWSTERRMIELDKCQILCHDCHEIKGVTNQERGQWGETNHRTKLTNEDVREIRRLYSTGNYSQRSIGERFGLHKDTICNIVNRRTWKHVL